MSASSGGTVYICPMHTYVRQSSPGRCPDCDMPLMPEGTRFALLRHIAASPLHLAILGIAMTALMVTAILLMR